MTYDARERSRWFAQPINLFRFTRGTLVWRFATGARAVTLGDETFVPAQIARGKMQDSTEQQKNNLDITFAYSANPGASKLPATQSLGDNWRPFPPGERVLVDVMGLQYGDSDFVVEWTGRVVSVKYSDTDCKITCDPSVAPARGSNFQGVWQRGCWKQLYSQGPGLCNAEEAPRTVAGALTAVDGVTLTAAVFGTLPAGRLAGGVVSWLRPDGLTDIRSIMSHTGSSIVVQYGAADLAPGLAVTAKWGCKHTWDDCGEFDNQINYGGCRYKPIKNPYSGNPVQ